MPQTAIDQRLDDQGHPITGSPQRSAAASPIPPRRLLDDNGTPIATPAPSTIGAAPPFALEMSRVVTPAVGAILGGIRGAAMGAPAGPWGIALGGLAGAGVGALGGEGLQLGFEQLAHRAGVPGVQPLTPQGAGSRLAGAATTGMLGEATGRIATVAATPILKPFVGKLEPYAHEALQTFKDATGRPLVLPSEVSHSRLLGVAENVAEGSLLGGGQVAVLREARQTLAEQKALDLLRSVGPRTSGKQAGRGVISARKQAIAAFRAAEAPRYDEFRRLAQDIPMKTPRLDAFIEDVRAREAGEILPNAGLRAADRLTAMMEPPPAPEIVIQGQPSGPLNRLPASIQEILRQIPEAGVADVSQPLTAAQFQRTYSGLGKLRRQLERAAAIDPTKNNQLGLVKKLTTLARADLTETLQRSSPAAHEAFESAQLFSKLGNAQLFNEEIRRIARTAPEKLVIGTGGLLKANNSTAIEAVRDAVDPATFSGVQSAAMTKLLRANAITGRINWKAVLQRLDAAGEDTLAALFPQGHAQDIQRLSRLLVDLERKPAGGIGRVAIQLGQGGAATGLFVGGFTKSAAVVLSMPAVLARIMSSKIGTKWLSTGLEAAPGSPTALKATTQLLMFTAQHATRRDQPIGTPPPGPSMVPSPAIGAAPPAPTR